MLFRLMSLRKGDRSLLRSADCRTCVPRRAHNLTKVWTQFMRGRVTGSYLFRVRNAR